jgi:hypothetical protein
MLFEKMQGIFLILLGSYEMNKSRRQRFDLNWMRGEVSPRGIAYGREDL